MNVSQLGRVIVPVSDQDAAIAFYTEKLGFTVSADVPYGEGERWVEVSPPNGGAAIALTVHTARAARRTRIVSGSYLCGRLRDSCPHMI